VIKDDAVHRHWIGADEQAVGRTAAEILPGRVSQTDMVLRHAQLDQLAQQRVDGLGDGVGVIVMEAPIDLVPVAAPDRIAGLPFSGMHVR